MIVGKHTVVAEVHVSTETACTVINEKVVVHLKTILAPRGRKQQRGRLGVVAPLTKHRVVAEINGHRILVGCRAGVHEVTDVVDLIAEAKIVGKTQVASSQGSVDHRAEVQVSFGRENDLLTVFIQHGRRRPTQAVVDELAVVHSETSPAVGSIGVEEKHPIRTIFEPGIADNHLGATPLENRTIFIALDVLERRPTASKPHVHLTKRETLDHRRRRGTIHHVDGPIQGDVTVAEQDDVVLRKMQLHRVGTSRVGNQNSISLDRLVKGRLDVVPLGDDNGRGRGGQCVAECQKDTQENLLHLVLLRFAITRVCCRFDSSRFFNL